MDLLSPNSNPLKVFIELNKFKNFISEPSRVKTRFLKSINEESCSSTLIDVLIHNKDLIIDTRVIGCPFINYHKFIVGSIKLDKQKPDSEVFWSRNLSDANIKLLEVELSQIDYLKIDKLYTANDKWEYLKTSILQKLDKIAPLKKVTMKSKNKFPWFDLELFRVKKARDISYAIAIKSKRTSETPKSFGNFIRVQSRFDQTMPKWTIQH